MSAKIQTNAKIKTPDWVKNAVFYQIFPDRFARSERMPALPGVHFKPWGTPPGEQGYQGGNLYGIADKLDYLRDLGINALYLNPIFSSASNHRYHTFDYLQVDPLLGGNEGLRLLLDEAHARDMRVVLDAVFNHASRGFWAFHHILEEGGNSPYVDWFHIQDWPLRPYQHDEENPANYAAWWDIAALPKFNTDNPGVRQYLLDVARYWIDFGIDGWRLDVPEEIDDAEFWRDFRRTVKEGNPEAYIVGEVWHEAKDWLEGDRFDAVMNYVFNRTAYGFFAHGTLRTGYKPGGFQLRPLDAKDFSQAVERFNTLHHWEITQVQLNLLDSHDTARALWIVDGDESALRLCALFQMTMPGTPCVYYGAEIGMTAGDDPDCRGAFPWDDKETWHAELLDFYKRIIAMRHAHEVLRTGRFQTLLVEKQLYGFGRVAGDAEAVIIFNAGEADATASVACALQDGTIFHQVWPQAGDNVAVVDGQLADIAIPARDAVVLIHE